MRFNDFHPLILIAYFISVIALTMATMNPILLLLSFLGAFFSVIKLNRKSDIGIYIMFFLFISLSNPLFSHNGETVLFYLFDQRITFEAFIYGITTGVMIISIIYWFKLFSIVFTEDKLTWIIGKLSPKLSVIFCMSLRFVPLFKENAKSIYNAQISMGIFKTDTIKGKLNLAKNVLSALISLSVENAMETADIMHSREYGNKNRSFYSLFTLTKCDIFSIFLIIAIDCILVFLFANNAGVFHYYPAIRYVHTTESLLLYIFFSILCFLPFLNDLKEDIKWKYLISKI